MKASKESICGVLAAITERKKIDLVTWRDKQQKKVDYFVQKANSFYGIDAESIADPAGMPISRVHLSIDPNKAGLSAAGLANALRSGTPPIWTMSNALQKGQVILELVPLNNWELENLD